MRYKFVESEILNTVVLSIDHWIDIKQKLNRQEIDEQMILEIKSQINNIQKAFQM